MTEAEAIGALNGMADVAASQVSIWAYITFGYLTASYFLGKNLSQFQCLAISGLYSVVALLFGSSAVIYVHAWQLTRIREGTVFDEFWLSNSYHGYVGGTAFFLFAGTLISLYFMYNVRKTATT